MLVTLTEILKETRTKKYAVGAFKATEYRLAEAVIKAAEEEGVPGIMMVPTPAFKVKQTPYLMQFILDRDVYKRQFPFWENVSANPNRILPGSPE